MCATTGMFCTLLSFIITMVGVYYTVRIDNLLFSRLMTVAFLVAIGFFVSNPLLSLLLTIILLFSNRVYSPIKSDIIKDLEFYLFNKILLRSQTYLMLVFTGGIFLGLALPAVKNYPIVISIFVFLTTFLIYLVEYSNKKSFKEKIEKVSRTADPIESLKEAFELMLPFKSINSEDLIKNRIELWKNYKERQTDKN